MGIQITDHPPRTRCYKCGSTNVEAICHHCLRAMCSLHFRQPVNSKGKLLSIEFTELGLKETCGEVPFHCEACHHLLRPPYPALVIAGITILILALILSVETSIRFMGVLLGGATAALSYHMNKRRTENLIRSKPPLPLLPRFSTIQIRETVRGKIQLDSSGDYRISIPYTQGVLTLTSDFGKAERDQLEQYQRKYHLTGDQDVHFNAGFVTLRSASGIDYFNSLASENDSVLALKGTQPFSINVERHRSREWSKSKRYDLRKTVTNKSFPIRIVPSLIQEAGRRALDLEIQWGGRNTGTSKFKIHKIDLLDLRVPIAWGQIQGAGGGIVDQRSNLDDNGIYHSITWPGLSITDSERNKYQRTFSISFEDPIDVSDSIWGMLVVTFQGTLSDIEGISLFYPVGSRRDMESVDISTQLIIDFELSLAGLRYQDIRVVPDLNLQEDEGKFKALIVEGITPDHNTVIALTNAISEKYYIKRIIENPPSTGEQANLLNRYWDIAGRHYDGVYPIDYHIMLSGEVIKGDDFRAYSGTTKVSLTVQGAFANKEMEDIIVNFWEQLRYLIRTTLEQLSNTRISAHQDSTKWSSAIHPQNIALPLNEGSRIERTIKLQKRLDDLFELLTSGRLSEETFLRLKLEIEKELQSI